MLAHRSVLPIATLLAAAALALACDPGEEGAYGGDEVRSDKTRVLSPQVGQSDFDKQMKASTAFALDLYAEAATAQGNLFFSPHSISQAMAMLQAGARTVSEKEIAAVMHFDLPAATLHPVMNKLDLELAGRGQGKKGADGGKFRLNVVNAAWGQRGYTFETPYLDTLALNYGAGLRLLDFRGAPQASRQTINTWVEQRTEGRIKDLIPPPSITSDTRLVLTNAVYFNAAWKEAFKPENTAPGTFLLADGAKVSVPMMHGTIQHATYHGEAGVQVLGLPYDGDELSMVVLLPDAGTLAAFEQGLTATRLDSLLGKLGSAAANLTLPKFKIDARLPIKTLLASLGISATFQPGQADLSGINGRRDLYVSDVLHKAFVQVTEAGTEAAAATAVVVSDYGAPTMVTVAVDRPFLFLIRDHKTGAVLFMGRVTDPR